VITLRENLDLLELLFEAFNVEQFLDKARAVMELVRRGATQGERDAGKLGMPMGEIHTWLDDALNIRFGKIGESRRYKLAA
jgi:hypothetical protein